MTNFSSNELRRYARHFSLSEVGTHGQEKLRRAKVLVVGAGGLASPVLQYLAAAGVGTIGVVDDDKVDVSNLQRQVVFTTADQGRTKVDVCREYITALNPNVEVVTHNTALTESNALDLLQGYDIVIDCTDNFATRYTVNDACSELKKPNVYASISQFDGQCTVFTAQEGPCYRCVYPEAPPEGLIPNCAEAGVIGALSGILGTLQAMQAINLILDIGEPLIGRLLLVDALNFRFRELPINRSVDCACCVQGRPFKDLPRPAFRCNLDGTMTPEISVPEFIELQKQQPIFILDVRQPEEYETVNMAGHLIPLGELEDRLDEIDQSKPIIVHCHAGIRSAKAVALLAQHGITATNLQGGIQAWLDYHDNAQSMKKSTIANLMLVGVTAMWGLTFPLIHTALTDINPGLFVVLRLSVAALAIVPFIFFRLTKVNTVLILGCLALALLNTGTYLFQTQGLLTIPASRSAFITGLSVVMVPLFMPFFRPFFHSVKPDFLIYLSVAVCLIGLYILTGANLRQLSVGDLWTFGCAVCYALYIIVMQIMSVRERDFALLCFYQIFFCVPFALPFANAMPIAQLLQWPVIAAVVFCAVFATSLSIYLQSRYQRDTTATKTALIFALEPVFATIFAYFLNDSAITISTLVGGILILLSIVLRDVWVAITVQH